MACTGLAIAPTRLALGLYAMFVTIAEQQK